MFFHIKVSAKDKKVLENFSHFISKLQFTSNSVRLLSKHNSRKFVTVLKSPHVNKTAQEQFEFRVYTREFVVSSFKPLTFFLILKKINNLSFSGLNLKIESLFKQNAKKKLIALDPDNVDLNALENPNNESSSLSKPYIQLFDCYGEMVLKIDFH